MPTEEIVPVIVSASRVIALVATIPARRTTCERLLSELARQSQVPDGVVLVLDGYGEAPSPACALPVVAEYRSAELSGAGARWKALENHPLDGETIVVCLDDDVMLHEASGLVKALVATVESGGGAAAAMGRDGEGKFAPPGPRSRGDLIYAAGCGLAMRAKHLVGLQAFAAGLQAGGGPDTLGLLGDDDAIVSAHLWKTGVPILHAATGNIFAAPGTRSTSQTAKRAGQRVAPDAQKMAIHKLTGWPWVGQRVVGVAVRPGVRSWR